MAGCTTSSGENYMAFCSFTDKGSSQLGVFNMHVFALGTFVGCVPSMPRQLSQPEKARECVACSSLLIDLSLAHSVPPQLKSGADTRVRRGRVLVTKDEMEVLSLLLHTKMAWQTPGFSTFSNETSRARNPSSCAELSFCDYVVVHSLRCATEVDEMLNGDV